MSHRAFRTSLVIAVAALAAGQLLARPAGAVEPVNYKDHVRRIFREKCNSCHNPNRKRAGLDLSSYAAALQGSSSGPVLVGGDPDDSILYLSMTHREEPFMPPGNKPVDDGLLEQVRLWIALGLPEESDDVDPDVLARLATDSADAADTPTATPAATPAAKSDAMPARQSSSNGLRVYRGPRLNPVTALAVSPDGRWAAVSGQLQVLVWDLKSQQLAQVLPLPEGEAFDLRFSHDGRLLLAGCGQHADSGQVVIWETATGDRSHVVGSEYDVVLTADLSPDGQTLILGGPERIVKVVDLATGQLRGKLTNHTDWVMSGRFSHEGVIFCSSDRAGNVYVWETDSSQQLHSLRGHRGSVNGIQWSLSGDECITAGADGTIRVWNMHDGSQVSEWSAHEGGVQCLTRTPGGSLVSAGRDLTVKQWSPTGELLHSLSLKSLPLELQAINDEEVLVGTAAGKVQRVRVSDPDSLVVLTIPESMVTDNIAELDQTVPELPAASVMVADTLVAPESATAAGATEPAAVASKAPAGEESDSGTSAESLAAQLAELYTALPARIEQVRDAQAAAEAALAARDEAAHELLSHQRRIEELSRALNESLDRTMQPLAGESRVLSPAAAEAGPRNELGIDQTSTID